MFPLTESAFWLISFCVVFLPMALPLAGYRRVAAFVGAGVLFWLLLWRTGPTSIELAVLSRRQPWEIYNLSYGRK